MRSFVGLIQEVTTCCHVSKGVEWLVSFIVLTYEKFRKTYLTLSLLFSSYQNNAHFLYSITIYMLHYNPQHVSSSNLLIFRRTNFIIICCSSLSTDILYGRLQRVTIPEAVIIQFVLLRMSKVLIETC